MEKDPIAQVARMSADMTSASFDLWRKVLDELALRQQEVARRMLPAQHAPEVGDADPMGHDWQAYCQDNLQRSVELSSGAWDAFYSTQRSLMQVCEQMAMEQGRLLEQGWGLVLGSARATPSALREVAERRLEAVPDARAPREGAGAA